MLSLTCTKEKKDRRDSADVQGAQGGVPLVAYIRSADTRTVRRTIVGLIISPRCFGVSMGESRRARSQGQQAPSLISICCLACGSSAGTPRPLMNRGLLGQKGRPYMEKYDSLEPLKMIR